MMIHSEFSDVEFRGVIRVRHEVLSAIFYTASLTGDMHQISPGRLILTRGIGTGRNVFHASRSLDMYCQLDCYIEDESRNFVIV